LRQFSPPSTLINFALLATFAVNPFQKPRFLAMSTKKEARRPSMTYAEYIEAPTEFEDFGPAGAASVFLAGGISDCENWQRRVSEELAGTGLVVLNPRRRDFPINDPSAAEAQIEWEHRHLQRAAARLFWFPPQTLCPIALYELGAWASRAGSLFVGTDPAYARRTDVLIQLRLARPDVVVTDSLQELIHQVKSWADVMFGRRTPAGRAKAQKQKRSQRPCAR
jgi:hypothetical protein